MRVKTRKGMETSLEEPQEPMGEEAAPLPGPAPEPLEAPEKPDRPPMHPLEAAPVNSKIVVTLEGAVLATPAGVVPIPAGDPAKRLPVGAKIIKCAGSEGGFVYLSTQLSAVFPQEPKTYDTALEAILNFVEHHHPNGLNQL